MAARWSSISPAKSSFISAPIALRELPRAFAPDVRAEMVAAGKRSGFTYVTVDLAGYRVGSHNEVLAGRSLPIVG